MKKVNKNRLKKLTRPLLGVLVILLVGATIFGLGRFRQNQSDKPNTTADGQAVNLEPASETEQAEAENHKNELLEQERQANSAPSGSKKSVSIVITEASATSIRAYVNGVFEEGGTCTASAQQGSSTVSKSSTGFQNVSYTQCAPIEWDTPLSKGQWTVTVTYKSATAEGSTVKTFEVK